MKNATEEIFASTLALPPSERTTFLMRACRGDEMQIARVQSLLADLERSAEFMKEAGATQQCGALSDRIDNYRLIEELGEGGCGTVYLAEQLVPIRREVAIKIIKLGMDTKAVVARFEAERQVLALMDHPHIARVFDAGATHSGRPYFVMEVVRGIRITDYCDQCRLTIRERLALFINVCAAIQHAHIKGVIHRDIKPSNMLVTLIDGVAVPKVIDFGVAKAMHGRLANSGPQTVVEQFIGTPAYVSPEQTQRGENAVDTRSDVYSLGCLLYELLTGYTPIDATSLYESSLAHALGRIANEIPPSPSARVALMPKDERMELQSRRQTTQVEKALHGDLDTIVMKCLEKDKEHRYQSAHDLGRDLQRFLSSEPIEARPPSAVYSMRMFARRHRRIFAASIALSFTLLIGVGVSTWQVIRASRAELLSQQAIGSLVKAFELTDPYRRDEENLSVQSLLRLARTTAYEELAFYPQAQADLLLSIGRIARRQGDFEQASQLLTDAAAGYRELGNSFDARLSLCSTLVELSSALRNHGDLKRAVTALAEAEAVHRRLGATRTMLDYEYFLEKGYVARDLGAIRESRSHFEASVRTARQLAGDQSLELATALNALAIAHVWMDEHSDAEDAARKAFAIRANGLPTHHPSRLDSEKRVAEILLYQGRFEAGEKMLLGVVERTRSVFGANNLEVAQIYEALAQATRGQRRFAASLEHSREAIRAAAEVQKVHSTDVAYYRTTLGYTLLELERYQEAEAELRKAQDAFATSLPPRHPYMTSVQYGLAEVFLKTHRVREAEQTLRACADRTSHSFSIPWQVARAQSALGEALFRQGQREEGEFHILTSYPILHNARGVDVFARDRARARVIRLYQDQRRDVELADFLAKYPDPASDGLRLVAGGELSSGKVSSPQKISSSATVSEPKSLAAH